MFAAVVALTSPDHQNSVIANMAARRKYSASVPRIVSRDQSCAIA